MIKPSLEEIRKADECGDYKTAPVDWILLDHGEGGTGEAFDWSLAGALNRPFFLAGGLAPENVGAVIDACRPYAVDVSSGVENGGIKDYNKMKQLVAAVRSANG